MTTTQTEAYRAQEAAEKWGQAAAEMRRAIDAALNAAAHAARAAERFKEAEAARAEAYGVTLPDGYIGAGSVWATGIAETAREAVGRADAAWRYAIGNRDAARDRAQEAE